MTDPLLAFLQGLPERALLCFVGVDAVAGPPGEAELELAGPRAASTDAGVATDNFSTPADHPRFRRVWSEPEDDDRS